MLKKIKNFVKKSKGELVKIPFFNAINSFVVKVRSYLNFKSDFNKFKKSTLLRESRFILDWNDRNPRLYDKINYIPFDPHYIYHPAWAARVLAKTKPKFHIDISSIFYIATTISAFIPIKFYEYRHSSVNLSGLTLENIDLLKLPFKDKEVKSISCMHVIEHLGLGRYGDPIDPDSDLKAIDELKRVLAPKGNLLFVVPVGIPKIKFNSLRVYSYSQVTNYFSELKLKEFVLITDNSEYFTGLQYNVNKNIVNQQNYGCGCFWFQRIKY